jgi:hypothetical protein
VSHLGPLARLTDWILSLPAWLVVGLVFLFPALEASAFVGFVFPGAIAVILGGVVAYQGASSAVGPNCRRHSGAVIGDSLGYFIGRRWGQHLLRGTIGHLPIIRKPIDEHLASARAYVRRRKAALSSLAASRLACGCWYRARGGCPTSITHRSCSTTCSAWWPGPGDSRCSATWLEPVTSISRGSPDALACCSSP